MSEDQQIDGLMWQLSVYIFISFFQKIKKIWAFYNEILTLSSRLCEGWSKKSK